ncbi:MAG: PEGA domain-containing protein [Treponema sp.]
MKKKCRWVFFIIYICSLYAVYAADTDTAAEWLISAAEFTLLDVPEVYTSYAASVPEMLNIFCSGPVQRHISTEERKARLLITYSEKKLALIKERAQLIKERDNYFLAVADSKKIRKKVKALAKQITAKEKEITQAQHRIEELLHNTTLTGQVVPVSVWKDGSTVFKQPEHTNIEYALKDEKISAVITGSIKDIAGYMYISATLTTGLNGLPEYTFSEAGHYQHVESIVQALAAKIIAAVRNIKPIKVRITVEPEDAELYVNNRRIEPGKQVVHVYAGTHRIEARAVDYETAYKTVEAKDQTNYLLKIKLEKTKKMTVGFTFKEPDADIFLHTHYFGSTPFNAELPKSANSILQFSHSTIRSYLLIRPDSFTKPEQSTYTLQASLNKEQTKAKINRQRNILYWSLGAFYVSLPIFMILQGVTADMASAINSRSLAFNATVKQKYQALFISSAVMQGITICLGINYAVQLGLYLYAADQSIPKEPTPMR